MVSIIESLAIYEKRLEDRVAARVTVQLFQENRVLLTEYSVNLSVGGIFLEAEKLLAEGTRLVLHFELPDSRHFHCQARVAWVNNPQSLLCQDLPPGMGIQFIDLQPEDMESLREFVKKKLILAAW